MPDNFFAFFSNNVKIDDLRENLSLSSGEKIWETDDREEWEEYGDCHINFESGRAECLLPDIKYKPDSKYDFV